MQFVKDAHHTLFRVWELGVSFLGRLGRQYSRADKVRLRWPGLFRPGHYLLDYLRFSLRNWEWHKGKKHRHPHLNLILLLAKPVDAERPAHTQGKIVRLINSVPTVCGPGEQKAAVSDSSESFLRAAGYGQPQATSMLFKSLAPDNLTRYTIGKP